jgi:hypothetical protein
MKIDRNNFLIAAAMLGLGSVAVPACGASSNSERDTEVTTEMETPGGEYERTVETEYDVDQEEDGRTVTRETEVECEAEGDLAHLCREQRAQRSARLVEPRQAQPGDGQGRATAAGPKPEVVYEGTTTPPQAGTDTDGPTRE